MGRELPLECPHGKVIEWADFGCECGPNGSCLRPAEHRAPEWCEECDGPRPDLYIEATDANPERVGNGCMIYRVGA